MDSLDLIKLIREALHTNEEGAVIIDYIHEKLHDGSVLLASHYFGDVANDATATILIVTGAIPVHLTGAIRAGGEAQVQLYEGATASANGTAVTGFNLNRISTKTLNTKVFHTPTVAGGSEGTLIFNSVAPAGVGPQAGGGDLRQGSEYILKPDTVYYLVITNRSGNTHTYAIELEYYETSEDVM